MSMNSFHARAAKPKPKPAAKPTAHDGIRVDALLVQRGLAPSRTAAQRLIEEGRVKVGAGGTAPAPVSKPSLILSAYAELIVEPPREAEYVSRGGLKLTGELRHTGIDPRGRDCLDVGQSTGGFTDCLLQHGATKVVGIDVGHGQLHSSLAADPRVEHHEGINARNLKNSIIAGRQFDLIVADVSFISLTLIIPQLPPLLTKLGDLLLLVKPQFEVGPEHIGKGGIVADPGLYSVVRDKLATCCADNRLAVIDWFESPITGTDGNREFFIHAKHER
jgi:23S rRNA (cytidine1920-2'-O)/16S rRNA (cytidine1409-2'-O)-methyltransferase